MWETVLYEPGDVHCDKLPEPKLNPTGATIRLSASCNCGTDLWPFLTQHNPKKPAAELTATKQSRWPLEVLVAGGWIFMLLSIAILFDDKIALSKHGFGKAAVMLLLIGVLLARCWPRAHMLANSNSTSRSPKRRHVAYGATARNQIAPEHQT
jgi:hypothetical protein